MLVVGGEIDMASAPTLESAVAGVLAEDALALVIDLSEVRFLASVGLSILVAAREKIGEPGRFAVAAQGPLISRIIQLVNLDELLSLHETLEDALLAVTGSKPGSDATPTA